MFRIYAVSGPKLPLALCCENKGDDHVLTQALAAQASCAVTVPPSVANRDSCLQVGVDRGVTWGA